jgi:hypothetical protein
LLPTLTYIAGQSIPAWCEGERLPGFRDSRPDPQRSIYAVNAKNNEKFKPIQTASLSMIKGNYRLSAYLGYPELKGEIRYEFFDLEVDPHERRDIFDPNTPEAAQMVAELNAKLAEVNKPFE